MAAWEKHFYNGDRLLAEVSLFGGALVRHIPTSELVLACAQIHRSYGVDTAQEPSSSFAAFQSRQVEPQHLLRLGQFLPVAGFARCFDDWVLYRRLPYLAEADPIQRIYLLQRLANILLQQHSGRPDLPYQVLMREATGSL